jgi:hypothetical protein
MQRSKEKIMNLEKELLRTKEVVSFFKKEIDSLKNDLQRQTQNERNLIHPFLEEYLRMQKNNTKIVKHIRGGSK